MKVHKIISKLIPDFRSSIAERRKIRAAYQEFREGIRFREQARFVVGDYDNSSLGIWDGNYHHRTVHLVDEKSVSDGDSSGNSGDPPELSIPKDKVREEVVRRARVMIWVLSIRNFGAYLFWTLWVLILAAVAVAIGTAVQSLIATQLLGLANI